MKKKYIEPEIGIVEFTHTHVLFSTSGVEGLTGGGESSGGMSGDSRYFYYDEEED